MLVCLLYFAGHLTLGHGYGHLPFCFGPKNVQIFGRIARSDMAPMQDGRHFKMGMVVSKQHRHEGEFISDTYTMNNPMNNPSFKL